MLYKFNQDSPLWSFVHAAEVFFLQIYFSWYKKNTSEVGSIIV
jgi:hypothetical protein